MRLLVLMVTQVGCDVLIDLGGVKFPFPDEFSDKVNNWAFAQQHFCCWCRQMLVLVLAHFLWLHLKLTNSK